MKSEVPLPVGMTSDRTWHNFNKKRKIDALKGYTVILATSEHNRRLKYWRKIITLSGGKTSCYTSERSIGKLTLDLIILLLLYLSSCSMAQLKCRVITVAKMFLRQRNT